MSDISNDTIAAAEAVLGVRYSESERTLMRDNLAPHIENARKRRALVFANDLGPATRFDPRLPRIPGAANPDLPPSGGIATCRAACPNRTRTSPFAPVHRALRVGSGRAPSPATGLSESVSTGSSASPGVSSVSSWSRARGHSPRPMPWMP